MCADEKRVAIEDAIEKLPNGSQTALAQLAGVTQDEVHYHKLALHGKPQPVCIPKVTAHIIWQHTDARLDVMAAQVREGVGVDAASEFARWLSFSGIVDILPEQAFPLPCHPVELRSKTARLISECGEWFANHERSFVKPHPAIPKTELERINAQLGDLHRAIASISEAVGTGSAQDPQLLVLPGGATS